MSSTARRTLLFSAAPLAVAALLVAVGAVTAIHAQMPEPAAPPAEPPSAPPMGGMMGQGQVGPGMMNNMCMMAQRHTQNMAELDRILEEAQAAAMVAKDVGATAKITQARELIRRQQQMNLQMMQDNLRQAQQCVQQMQSQMQAQGAMNQRRAPMGGMNRAPMRPPAPGGMNPQR